MTLIMKWIDKIRDWKTDKQTLIRERDNARWDLYSKTNDYDKLFDMHKEMCRVFELPIMKPNPWDDLETYIQTVSEFFYKHFNNLYSVKIHDQTNYRPKVNSDFVMRVIIIKHSNKQTIFKFSGETKPHQEVY